LLLGHRIAGENAAVALSRSDFVLRLKLRWLIGIWMTEMMLKPGSRGLGYIASFYRACQPGHGLFSEVNPTNRLGSTNGGLEKEDYTLKSFLNYYLHGY
jgi:hypothetical protein